MLIIIKMGVDLAVYTIDGYLIKDPEMVKKLNKIDSLCEAGCFICEPYGMTFGILSLSGEHKIIISQFFDPESTNSFISAKPESEVFFINVKEKKNEMFCIDVSNDVMRHINCNKEDALSKLSSEELDCITTIINSGSVAYGKMLVKMWG